MNAPVPETVAAAPAALRRTQAALALVLAAVCLGSAGVLDALARSEAVADGLQARLLAYCDAHNVLFRDTRNCLDEGDRLLLDDLPRADHSRGGVYFIGASTMMFCLKTWELPPEEAALIHNYGVSAANHSMQLQFLHYLVDHKGFLPDAGGKDLIVLGLSSSNVAESGKGPHNYLPQLFMRYGLYNYDAERGITPAAMNPAGRFILIQKARISSFLHRCLLGVNVLPMQNSSTQENQEKLKKWMGRQWPLPLEPQMAELGRTIDFLKGRHAAVVAVVLPVGSWNDALP